MASRPISASELESCALAIIGGSGMDEFPELGDAKPIALDTPYGSAMPAYRACLNGLPLLFLPRHGPEHKLAPHCINYRANLWALQQLGARRVLAVNAVGGIREDMAPGKLVLPDQIIDYSYGRAHSYFEGGEVGVMHAGFDEPYTRAWREELLLVAQRHRITLIDGGVYGCTQGPRLETVAEIRRMRRDGCDMVGMTGMPEAALARELGLDYASLAVVVNWAAGIGSHPLSIEAIFAQLRVSIADVKELISHLLSDMAQDLEH